MRPQTIRRLLVFAVCCAGVAALYLVPGTAESPDQVTGGPGTQPEPPTRTVTEQPSPSPRSASPTATPTRPTATTTVTATPGPTSSTSSTPDPTSSSSAPEDDESDPPSPSPTPTATPTDDPEDPEPEPTDDPTSEPPSQVTGVKEIESTHEQLTIGWDAASDDEGIKKYVIYLNGYATSAQHPDSPTEGTIGWEINTEDGYFVQVAAVDTDDQEGKRSKALGVDRPPEPSPSPDPPGGSETPDPPNLVPPPAPDPTTSSSPEPPR